MEKAIKHKVAKAVVPAIDVMFQALRFAFLYFLTRNVCLLLLLYDLFFLFEM